MDGTGYGKGGPIVDMAQVKERGLLCCERCGAVDPKSSRWKHCERCAWAAGDLFMAEADAIGFPGKESRGCDRLPTDLRAAIHSSLKHVKRWRVRVRVEALSDG